MWKYKNTVIDIKTKNKKKKPKKIPKYFFLWFYLFNLKYAKLTFFGSVRCLSKQYQVFNINIKLILAIYYKNIYVIDDDTSVYFYNLYIHWLRTVYFNIGKLGFYVSDEEKGAAKWTVEISGNLHGQVVQRGPREIRVLHYHWSVLSLFDCFSFFYFLFFKISRNLSSPLWFVHVADPCTLDLFIMI